MKTFNSTFDFLEHLVGLYGELHFTLSATPYGAEFEWTTDFEEFDSIIKLKEVLVEFDDQYHYEYELERGSSRKYILKASKAGLICRINYEWDYSYLGTKWLDKDLIDLIRDEIDNRLSKEIGVTTIEFTDNYYYNIVFSTEDTVDYDEFLLSDCTNDNIVEIPLSTWNSLKEAIIELSYDNGANTSENDCQFDFNLTNQDDGIIEKWSNDMELEKLMNDNKSYQLS